MANAAIKVGDIIYCAYRGHWLFVTHKDGQNIRGVTVLRKQSVSTTSRKVTRVFREMGNGRRSSV